MRGPRVAPRPERSGVKKTLDRVLSIAGVGSRTEARHVIEAGRVCVNRRVVIDPDAWVRIERDAISLDGRVLKPRRREYLLLHKPKGYLCTARDPRGRPTIFDLLPSRDSHLFSAGRLDLDTTGLIILTNDSQLANHLTDPHRKVAKTYRVTASPPLSDDAIEALRRGIALADGPALPARVRRLEDREGVTVAEIVIKEGRNRQVRRMIEAVGSEVVDLERIAIGPIRIGDLRPGGVRPLRPDEIRGLYGSRKGLA